MTKANCVKAVLQMTHLVIKEGPLLPGTRRSTAKLERQQPRCTAAAQNENMDFALRAAAFHFLVIAANGRSQFSPETGLGRLLPVFAFW